MKRIVAFVEGPTEETALKNHLGPKLEDLGVRLDLRLFETSPGHIGGFPVYGRVKKQIQIELQADDEPYVTTLLDLYRLPSDFPGKDEVTTIADCLERAAALELRFLEDIGHDRFIPNLAVHEFEALLFSDPTVFGAVGRQLQLQRDAFPTPEHINDGEETAPSKRILRLCSDYSKKAFGSILVGRIGLDTIRRECPHFNAWVRKLEQLGEGNQE